MTGHVWLAFSPRYQSTRRADRRPIVGAHAFSRDLPRSLCGYVARESDGDPAAADARRCTACERAIERSAKLIAKQTRHDVAQAVARHAGLEES